MLEPRSSAPFPTTLWSRVIAAGQMADCDALAALCAAYWFPVYAFIRHKGHDAESAQDLAQGYFTRLLEKRSLAVADPGKGRFRSFLRTDIAFFLGDCRDREAAVKRGGSVRFVPIDAEGRYAAEPIDNLTPDRLFDRAWALSLLSTVVDRLRTEFASAGKADAFEVLKVVLEDDPREVHYGEVASRLGTNVGAAQVAAHRLRKRYRDVVREAIAATVDNPAEVEDEIRALFAALG